MDPWHASQKVQQQGFQWVQKKDICPSTIFLKQKRFSGPICLARSRISSKLVILTKGTSTFGDTDDIVLKLIKIVQVNCCLININVGGDLIPNTLTSDLVGSDIWHPPIYKIDLTQIRGSNMFNVFRPLRIEVWFSLLGVSVVFLLFIILTSEVYPRNKTSLPTLVQDFGFVTRVLLCQCTYTISFRIKKVLFFFSLRPQGPIWQW